MENMGDYSEFRHENLSSILGTEHEVFSLDGDDAHGDAPPTFREQNRPSGVFFTEQQAHDRKESGKTSMVF